MRWMLIILVMESFLWGMNLNSARADIIGFQFSGSWTRVDSAFTSLLTYNQPVTGSIYYDTTIPDKDSTNKRAYYYGSDSQIINLSFTTNNKTPAKIKKARIAIFDDSVKYNNSTTPPSEFQLWFNTNGGTGTEIEPTSLPANTTGSFLLQDTQQLLADDLLPCDISLLQAMSSKSFTLSLPQQSFTAVAEIDSITPLPVPEPETIVLLCLGLGLIPLCRGLNNRKGGLQKLRT